MSEPAIDEGVLRGLLDDMGGDREVVKELIQSFLEEAPKLLAEGRAGLAAGDAALVHRAFHTLKSTAATFGALPLSSLARDVEQGARAGQLPDAGKVAAIERLLEASRRELLLRLG